MRCGCATFIVLFVICFAIWAAFFDNKVEPEEIPTQWEESFYESQEIPRPLSKPHRESYIPDSLPLRVNKEQQLIIEGKRYRVRYLANGTQELILIR